MKPPLTFLRMSQPLFLLLQYCIQLQITLSVETEKRKKLLEKGRHLWFVVFSMWVYKLYLGVNKEKTKAVTMTLDHICFKTVFLLILSD